MALRNKNPSYPRYSDTPLPKVDAEFYGMLSGVPASEIPDGYSAKNYNVIDRGGHYNVRNGSRQYTSFKIGHTISSVDTGTEIITLSTVHQWNTGDAVYMKGDGLPTPLSEDTAYYVIKIDSKNIKLATTYSNAVAGTAINLSSTFTETSYVYYGEINGRYDHAGFGVVVFVLGSSVYVANKKLNVFTRVLNLHSVDPTGVTTACGYNDDVYIFSSTGIFRVVLNDTFYWMDKINKTLPDTLITDDNETLTKIYGYLYFYSMSKNAGTGNRDRQDSEIEFESGTALDTSVKKDYGEVFFTTEIGVDATITHSIGTLTLPDDTVGVTHFPLYRTRQIGENSGGSGVSIESIGNRRDYVVWVADVPVAKAFVIDTSTAPGDGTIVSGNKFVLGDVSCTLKDAAGNTGTIDVFTDEDNVELGAGLASGTAIYCAIGGGRVMQCSQSGTTVTRSAGDTFDTSDKGLTLFVSDGTYRHVVRYLTANTAEVAETGDFTDYAVTLKPLSGNFSRKWNDSVPDDPQGDGRVSWDDLSFYGGDLNVPRRLFKPVLDCNIGIIDKGFMVCADRGTSKFYYSQIGDKDYCMGYYKNPEQSKKISGSINHMVLFPSKVVLFTDKTTVEISLASGINVGRVEIGEDVRKLSEPDTIDTERGCKAWQTIVWKKSNLMFALCSDLSWRTFDGNTWGEDLSVINGRDAVASKYLKLLDHNYDINSFYSSYAGAKIWFRKWEDLEDAEGNIYNAVEYTLNDTDTNVQLSLSDYSERGSGMADVQLIVI